MMNIFTTTPEVSHEEVTGFEFPFLFASTSFRSIAATGFDPVFCAQIDPAVLFSGDLCDRHAIGEDVIRDGLAEILIEYDCDESVEGGDGLAAVWDAVVEDRPLSPEALDLAKRVLMCEGEDDDDTYWRLRDLRHQLALRLGFSGSVSDDDVQTLTLDPAFVHGLDWRAVDHDPEDEDDDS